MTKLIQNTFFLLFFSIPLVCFSQHSPSPPLTVSSLGEEIFEAEEALYHARRVAHEADVEQGKKPIYVATITGKDFSTDEKRVSVRINGIQANDILLHNATAFTFRIPTPLALNRDNLFTASVEIHMGSARYAKIPLAALQKAISKVDLDDFQQQIANTRRERLKEGTQSHLADHDEDDIEDIEEDLHEKYDGYRNEDHDADSEETANVEEEDRDVDPETKERNERVSRAEDLLLKRTPRASQEALDLLMSAILQRDPRAMTIYGAALLSGSSPGIPNDMDKAVRMLHKASDMGYPDAQALMGFLYASGIAGTALRKDIGAAILMWTIAAEGGSTYAMMALGYRYLTGTDVAEDCDKASVYYKSVADEVFAEMKDLSDRYTGRRKSKAQGNEGGDDKDGDIKPPASPSMHAADRKYLSEGMTQRVMGESNEVVQYYLHSADRGDPHAQVMMGSLYYYGAMDIPQDVRRARRLFTQAANAGIGEANAHLGFMDLRAGRNESAVENLKIAARKDEKLGYHGLGFVFLHGIGVQKNPKLAAHYFKKAAQKEHPEAMFNLAIMHSKGIGVTESLEEALKLFQAAAHGGHLQSSYQVGTMFLEGTKYNKKDCSMATQYFKLVSQQGVWNRILSMAFRAYERSAYADALYRYLQAAHAGIQLAQYNAAFMFEFNKFTNIDSLTSQLWGSRSQGFTTKLYTEREAIVEEALELYQMSANQGHRDSMVRMGDLAFGEAKDYARAATAYERAAHGHGHSPSGAEAMFNLGWMHALGFGRNADKHMAKRYFDLAMEKDIDAKLPASIALFFLGHSDAIFSFIEKVTSFLDQCKKLLDPTEGEAEVPFFDTSSSLISTDILALSVLLAILVPVLILRRVRLSSGERRGQRAADQDVADQEEITEERANEQDGAGHEHED